MENANQRPNLCPNRLVEALGKDQKDFTRDDIIRYIVDNGIKMVNFMYPAGDSRVKTLNFVINDYDYLETILTCGERVDGSSLFSYIEAGNSDLYVIPRFNTAFIDPFAEIPTLSMLCSFFNKDGEVLDCSPDNLVRKAVKSLKDVTGLTFDAMGELEYYVVADASPLFRAQDQRGYHESSPYAKFNDFRAECMLAIAQIGGRIKYGHSEVGNFTMDGKVYEQNEIEFLPTPIETAADQILLAKWVIRNLAFRHSLDVTFAPKITAGKAGSGLHIHMRLMRDGRNVMLDADRHLSVEARKAIAGMMLMAQSITAFGNKIPTSYFRLVPHQEAPTNICWGDRNRSVLVRVPLGWTTTVDMSSIVNPSDRPLHLDITGKQTVEMRSPDGSADIYQLMAGLCVACRHGFEVEDALKIADDKYVDVDIHKPENAAKLASLDALPKCCTESADCLERQRAVYEQHGVFSPAMIDGIVRELRAYDDADLYAKVKGDRDAELKMVEQYYYCG
ncbi:MAG TPA: glutamine synthetase [Candidatus Avibacteroides faecavium]|nr:glutamine synthetase [Candidatus Avibacteroides faecavium]